MDSQMLDEFLALPVNRDETWLGGVATAADLTDAPAELSTEAVGMALWRSVPSELVHGRPIVLDADDAFEQFVDSLIEMVEVHKFAFRPAVINCNERQFAAKLNRYLKGSGTVVHYQAQLDKWEHLIQSLSEFIASSLPSGLPTLRTAGCSDDMLREFAIAAAEFYRAKLWDLLTDVDLIKFESPKSPTSMKYAVVLGAAGQSYGLGFYEDEEDHNAIMAQTIDPRKLNLFSFIYENPTDVAEEDVRLWKELDLPLETGDAFPDPYNLSADGARRPTPAEIKFLTLVLKGLASTSEGELDSGRWTKSVEIAGKRRKCVFSIPNLLNPPDHVEWMRRDKMPDRRAMDLPMRMVQQFISSAAGEMDIDELNNAINAKFSGRLPDSDELPRNTPSERAEALYQEALENFGRRRVLLAREALAEDPNHAEASILIAELTRAPDVRIEMFGNAKAASAKTLGKKMKEFSGDFWLIPETRPYMRACQGLAESFADAGQINEAIEQYAELLERNPEDNQGARYAIVPLLLAQDRNDEALAVLDSYQEESAIWLYLKAFAKFRSGENSVKSRQAIRKAFQANEHVVPMLIMDEPVMLPADYELGSPEEAAICLHDFDDLWHEDEEFTLWMLQEYRGWDREREKKRRDRQRKLKQNRPKRK